MAAESPVPLLNLLGLMRLKQKVPRPLIEAWNQQVDSLLAPASERSYIPADELYRLGLLQAFLKPGLVHLITSIVPNPVLYHAHVYDLAGGSANSHVHGQYEGWHRDEECKPFYKPGQTTQFSLFCYLSDVGPDDGPFELRPLSPIQIPRPGDPTIKVLGEAGTLFLFNRFFYHRPNPNKGNRRRRVLKLSFQSYNLANDRIHLPEFEALRELALHSNDSIWYYLAGGLMGQKSVPDLSIKEGRFPEPDILIPNAAFHLDNSIYNQFQWKSTLKNVFFIPPSRTKN